jgi:primosomal protein N' (replication factor Y)
MELWRWMAGYYMCTPGDVMRFALPASLKPKGMSDEEFERDEYRPRMVKYVSLHPSLRDEGRLDALCEELLRRSRAQYAALMQFCEIITNYELRITNMFSGEVPRARLRVSAPVLRKMIDREIFVLSEKEAALEGPVTAAGHIYRLPQLSGAQSRAKAEIDTAFGAHTTTLLHGVTGSGKTEIYMHLIAEQLARGKSVLYMMPEIAMTSQLVGRIRKVFGGTVTVYHSKLSDARRAEAYRRLGAAGGGQLILGVRSSIFLPLPELGLVIVDEEHDASYKQSDPAPRYHARDCAVYMARLWGAGCLLASATPSIESYTNAGAGKYGLVTLAERYGDGKLPEVTVSDTLRAVKRGERRSHFNKDLLDRIGRTLAAGRQVMLFQNRRGFAPYIECGECGWTAGCPRCSVTLTFHKHDNRLRCHTCGYSAPVVAVCPKCGAPSPRPQGFGTEKVEEQLASLFPEARVVRLDRDTATSATRYEKIIRDFERGDADILVGTQMITKGFDFPRLSLVGILNADNLLNYPDFRASERAYQTMTQVAGRAGRADDRGEVVIQTSRPDDPVIVQVRNLDYEGMVRTQLAERRPFHYPPYGRIITVSLKHYKKELVEEGASHLAAQMRAVFGDRVFGPHAPVVEKVKNENYLSITLKVESGRSFSKVKELLGAMIEEMSSRPGLRNISVSCNVDPQ